MKTRYLSSLTLVAFLAFFSVSCGGGGSNEIIASSFSACVADTDCAVEGELCNTDLGICGQVCGQDEDCVEGEICNMEARNDEGVGVCEAVVTDLCAAANCGANQACDVATGSCVDTAPSPDVSGNNDDLGGLDVDPCATVSCEAGQHCDADLVACVEDDPAIVLMNTSFSSQIMQILIAAGLAHYETQTATALVATLTPQMANQLLAIFYQKYADKVVSAATLKFDLEQVGGSYLDQGIGARLCPSETVCYAKSHNGLSTEFVGYAHTIKLPLPNTPVRGRDLGFLNLSTVGSARIANLVLEVQFEGESKVVRYWRHAESVTLTSEDTVMLGVGLNY